MTGAIIAAAAGVWPVAVLTGKVVCVIVAVAILAADWMDT